MAWAPYTDVYLEDQASNIRKQEPIGAPLPWARMLGEPKNGTWHVDQAQQELDRNQNPDNWYPDWRMNPNT